METKICSKSKITKSFYEFNNSSSTSDGLRYECKTCCAQQESSGEKIIENIIMHKNEFIMELIHKLDLVTIYIAYKII